MIGYSASGIIIIVVMVILAIVLWKISKLLLIPIQIILFLALAFVIYKYCLTQENLDNLSSQVDHEKIQEFVDHAADSASRFVDTGKEVIKKSVEGQFRDSAERAVDDAVNAVRSPDKTDASSPQSASNNPAWKK